MKMIKKITAVTAALAAAASMSAVSFAANDFTATYDPTADTVSVDLETLTATFSDQITVVVVPKGAETIDSSNIYYIDQDSVANKDALLTGMGVLAGSMVAGNTYEVRIGCTEGTIYTAEYTVPSATPSYPLGDANLSGDITSADASVVLNSAAGNITLDETATRCADANKSGDITSADASTILNAAAGNITLEW